MLGGNMQGLMGEKYKMFWNKKDRRLIYRLSFGYI